jgi:tRNA U34 5-carboxymethylaminomethyl modifying GTPase MnmE/TrmE
MASTTRDVHVVFLGPTGSGKSHLCNFLLKDDAAFKTSIGFGSLTQGIEIISRSIDCNGKKVQFRFIDTQGVADTKLSDAQVIDVVKKAMKQNITYVNYFVIVYKPGRLTKEHRSALEDIIKAFKLDDDKRKSHVYFLLSNCDSASATALDSYKNECLGDATIKQLLCIENGQITNFNCVGIPKKGEVDDWLYTALLARMDSKRQELWNYLSVPREGIQAINDSFFSEHCSIL